MANTGLIFHIFLNDEGNHPLTVGIEVHSISSEMPEYGRQYLAGVDELHRFFPGNYFEL